MKARLLPWIKTRLSRDLNRGEQGVALLAVIVMLAVIGATVAEFSYNTKVDYTAAINARDDLRAHYLSRSALNIVQIPLRLQAKVIDPQYYAKRQSFGMDINFVDYAGMILSAFQDKEAAEGLGSLMGIAGEIKGLGVDVGSFDLEVETLDGRINVNCAGGSNPSSAKVIQTATALTALMMPLRYNLLFERQMDGQYYDRLAVMQGIVDWVDTDLQLYGSSAPEPNTYASRKDPYQTKNAYLDSIDELRLINGIDQDWMEAFSKQLTVYPGPSSDRCKISVSLADIPTLMALLLQYPDNPSDPALDIRNVALLAYYLKTIRELMGGYTRLGDFRAAAEDPMAWMAKAGVTNDTLAALQGGATQDNSASNLIQNLPRVQGIKLNAKIADAAYGSFSRRIYRLVAKSQVNNIKKKIIAVWDQQHQSPTAVYAAKGTGGYIYWREE